MFKQITPANAARYFDTQVEAKLSASVQVNLAICESDMSFKTDHAIDFEEIGILVKNINFDSSLIKYDENYITTVAFGEKDHNFLLSIIQNLYPRISTIYEIGCGQGEFMKVLSAAGISTKGCDPVYRGESKNIEKNYYIHTPNFRADLYVLRCVLPHLENPFKLLDLIFQNDENAKVVVTYPNLNWIFNSCSWASITNDHVNYFTAIEFKVRYDLIQYGSDPSGEWDYCVMQKKSTEKPSINTIQFANRRRGLQKKCFELQAKRDSFLEKVVKTNEKVIVWGAAGKGAVVALNLQLCGIEPIIVDLDPRKHNKYLECSGLKVWSPYQIDFTRYIGTVVAVNQNHKSWIQKYVTNSVATLSEF